MADWTLALRNLLRNRRRSLSTLTALAIGLCAILLFGGFKAYLIHTGITTYVRAGGHLQVQHRDYFLFGSGNPTAFAIPGYERLIQAIRNDAELARMVSVVTPTLRFGGLAGNFDAGISRTVIGNGYVADDFNAMRSWNEFGMPLTRVTFPLRGTAPDSVLVGEGLARVLQLCQRLGVSDCPTLPAAGAAATGSGRALPADIAALASSEHGAKPKGQGEAARIELLSSSSRGAPNVASLNVVAAENQGFKELDEASLVLHLQQAQRLVFGRSAPKATAIMVLLARTEDQPRALERLRAVIAADPDGASLVVRDFQELNPFYVQTERMFDVIFGFIFVLIAGIVLFTVGNTMNTAVVERTVEIGTLRAIGLRQGGVRRLFVVEGFLLGVTGTIAGVVAALLLAAAINNSGLTWLPPGSSEQLPLLLRVASEWLTMAAAAFGLVVIAAGSAWWPARRAANLNVVDALRHA